MTDTIILTVPQFRGIMAVLLPLVIILWHNMLTLTPEDKADITQILLDLKEAQAWRD